METTRRQRLDEASGLPAAASDGTAPAAPLEALDTPHAVPAPGQPLAADPLSSVAIPTLPLDFVRPADLVADAITASEVKAAPTMGDVSARDP